MSQGESSLRVVMGGIVPPHHPQTTLPLGHPHLSCGIVHERWGCPTVLLELRLCHNQAVAVAILLLTQHGYLRLLMPRASITASSIQKANGWLCSQVSNHLRYTHKQKSETE